jgi:hypothetical protein
MMGEKREKIDFDGGVTRLDGGAAKRTRGTMLWFNEVKDLGALRTDDGERLDVPGTAFAPGEKPVGGCAGKAIEFDARGGVISGLAFLPELSPRRARMRRGR